MIRTKWTAGLGVTLAIVLAGQAMARQSDTNLLQNPGAEAGAAPNDQSIVPPAGWTTTGSFTAAKYGGGGLPAGLEAAPGGGSNMFAGGPGSAISTAMQSASVASSAAAIDAGTVSATLSGWLGGWQGQSDSANVVATFLDGSGKSIGNIGIGPVTAADRSGKTGFRSRMNTGNVPAGTRSIRVTITANRSSGVYNDGYADNLALTLKETKLSGPWLQSITFRLSGSGPAFEMPVVADYVRSQIRGSGSVNLAAPLRKGGPAGAATSGKGTIRVLHQFALHTDKYWLAVRGGGRIRRTENGQFAVVRLVVGVTASTVPTCPKGRAGFLSFVDANGSPDLISIKLCGHAYELSKPNGSANVRVYPG